MKKLTKEQKRRAEINIQIAINKLIDIFTTLKEQQEILSRNNKKKKQ